MPPNECLVSYPWLSAEDTEGNMVLVNLAEIRAVSRDAARAQTIVHAAGMPWPCRIPDPDGSVARAIREALVDAESRRFDLGGMSIMAERRDVPPGTFDQFEEAEEE
jgi:hypothetical protein